LFLQIAQISSLGKKFCFTADVFFPPPPVLESLLLSSFILSSWALLNFHVVSPRRPLSALLGSVASRSEFPVQVDNFCVTFSLLKVLFLSFFFGPHARSCANQVCHAFFVPVWDWETVSCFAFSLASVLRSVFLHGQDFCFLAGSYRASRLRLFLPSVSSAVKVA
jgi:hypothetical protein